MASETLQEYLRQILSGLVSNPGAIEIEKEADEMGVKFTVRVAQGDGGKVIGKKGVIAEAVRTIIRAAGYNQDVRASVILDIPSDKKDVAW